MKMIADQKRKDFQFAKGDTVLLKLQPYTQSSVANRPFPKLTRGTLAVTKSWQGLVMLLPGWNYLRELYFTMFFHISQLKSFLANYSPVYDSLLVTLIWMQLTQHLWLLWIAVWSRKITQ